MKYSLVTQVNATTYLLWEELSDMIWSLNHTENRPENVVNKLLKIINNSRFQI